MELDGSQVFYCNSMTPPPLTVTCGTRLCLLLRFSGEVQDAILVK